jgi:prepilin-type N-terminal cleavage/methylation domain-containing protein
VKNDLSAIKGFTLVELLIVIVILGVLAGLLLITLSRGIQGAEKARCANNLGQLGRALQLFIGDNHAYPLESNPDYDYGVYPNHIDFWDLALDHELGSENNSHQADYKCRGIWKCPAAIEPPDWPENMFNKGTTRVVYVSYGYNAHGTCATGDTNWLGLGGEYRYTKSKAWVRPTPESDVVSPGEMLAMMICFWAASRGFGEQTR